VDKHPQADPATGYFQGCQQGGTDLKWQSQFAGRHPEHIVSASGQEVRVAANH
jgi:hypothetical protein